VVFIMNMERISLEKTRELSQKAGLTPCRVKGSTVVQLRKNPNDRMEDISWEEFDEALKSKRLAVYAAPSGYMKIMRSF